MQEALDEWLGHLTQGYQQKSANLRRKVKLPSSGIYFGGDRGSATVSMGARATCRNMQRDDAAFDAWALVLRVWCDVQRVRLGWQVPDNTEDPHYQRFLYRVQHFARLFDWFEIELPERLQTLKIADGGSYVLNVPIGDRSPKDITGTLAELSEDALEHTLLSPAVQKRLCALIGAEQLYRQIPVGVFAARVARANRIFAGGKSAIDLVATHKDGTISVFELKGRDNCKVGAVSELFFYAMVLRDVACGRFSFAAAAQEPLGAIAMAKRVRAYVLAPDFHPLLDGIGAGILDTLTAAMDRSDSPHRVPVSFSRVRLDDKLGFTLVGT